MMEGYLKNAFCVTYIFDTFAITQLTIGPVKSYQFSFKRSGQSYTCGLLIKENQPCLTSRNAQLHAFVIY